MLEFCGGISWGGGEGGRWLEKLECFLGDCIGLVGLIKISWDYKVLSYWNVLFSLFKGV